MEKIKLVTKFDFRTMKFCNLYLLNYKRKSYIMYIVLIALALGASSYFAFFADPKNYVMAGLFVLVALYVLYQSLSMEKSLDRSLTNFFYNRPVVEQTIELDEEGITITASTRPNEPQKYEWIFVNEIHAIPEFYMLFVGKNAPVILDRSAEALIEGTKEQLDLLIKEKAETKPYKEVNKTIVKRPITYVHNYVAPVNTKEAEVVEENKDEVKEENVEVVEATAVEVKEEGKKEE